MRAVTIDRFGDIDVLQVRDVRIPPLDAGEVMIRVDTAGVGEWDPFEREGGYARMLGVVPDFPYVLGSEGAGTVVAAGEGVQRVRVGERVYAAGFLNPKGGFYAEYAVVREELVGHVPADMSMEAAGVMSGVALTALRGIDDVLALQAGESVLVFGASGGIGHVAVQLARHRGARVLAVASGADGVALADALGADRSIDGRRDDILMAALEFAPGGVDAALLTAGGLVAHQALQAIRDGGRAAYPTGVQPVPMTVPRVSLSGYNGDPDADIMSRLEALLHARPLHVHVAARFPLADVASAHRMLDEHYLGKIALRVRPAG